MITWLFHIPKREGPKLYPLSICSLRLPTCKFPHLISFLLYMQLSHFHFSFSLFFSTPLNFLSLHSIPNYRAQRWSVFNIPARLLYSANILHCKSATFSSVFLVPKGTTLASTHLIWEEDNENQHVVAMWYKTIAMVIGIQPDSDVYNISVLGLVSQNHCIWSDLQIMLIIFY